VTGLPPTWVLTVAPRARVVEVRRCLASTGAPRDHTVVVTTWPDSIRPGDVDGFVARHIPAMGEDPVNISAWWNTGLDTIRTLAQEFGHREYQVLIVESDAVFLPSKLDNPVEMMADQLRTYNLGMITPDRWGEFSTDHDHPGAVRIFNHGGPWIGKRRFPGVAMMIHGEDTTGPGGIAFPALRFDPQFRWWFADDDLERAARAMRYDVGLGIPRGTGIVSWALLDHPAGNPLDSDRQRFADEDAERFRVKWGHPPIVAGAEHTMLTGTDA